MLNINLEQIISIYGTNKTNTSKQLLVSCLHIYQACNMWDVKHKLHLIFRYYKQMILLRNSLSNLNVIWYFLECIYSYGDTLKLIQFFYLIRSYDWPLMSRTSPLNIGHTFLTHIGILRHKLRHFILRWSWFLCLVVSRFVLKALCLVRDVDGEK